MFDFGAWGEFIVILLSAFILLGPKEMPKVFSMLAKVYKWILRIVNEFTDQAKTMADNYDLKDYQEKMHKKFKHDIEETFASIDKIDKVVDVKDKK